MINEAIVENGNGLVAYICVVAEEFQKLQKFNPEVSDAWSALVDSDNNFLSKILKQVKVSYSKTDPYKNQREMMYDIFVNKHFSVYGTEEDDSQEGSHPQFSNGENNTFRIVHDMLGHYAPNIKMFSKYLKDNDIKSTSDDAFKKLRFSSHSFTIRGEMNTFLTHSKTCPKIAIPALFTEIVGQICTYFVTGDFTENKVDIIDGIDFKNVGEFTSPQLQKQKQKYLDLLNDDSVNEFKINVGVKGLRGTKVTIDKSKIRWGLISTGEGKTHKLVESINRYL